MEWLRYAAMAGLMAIATIAGGAAVRVVVAAGDLQSAATFGLVAVLVVGAITAGARGRHWRRNPYW